MDAEIKRANWFFGLAGACVGGVVGYFVFFWLTRQGLYALALHGALVGLGCGLVSGGKSRGLGVVCGVAGAALAVITEWQFAPFVKDDGLWYFVTHLHQLRGIALIAIVASGLFGFWFGEGRNSPRTKAASDSVKQDAGKEGG
jgi:hypothetical protein